MADEIQAKSPHEAVNALTERFSQAAVEEVPEDNIEDNATEESEVHEIESENASFEANEDGEAEVELESSDEAESEGDESEEESEEEQFSHIQQLLEAGAVEADAISVTVKIDGEEKDVTLAEVTRGYQRQADYDRHMREIRESKAEIQAQRENILDSPEIQEKLQVFEDAFQLASMVINGDAQALQQQYENTDWAKLRAEDESKYAVLQADFSREAQNVQRRQQELQAAYQNAKQEQEKNRNEQAAKFRAEQRQRLAERHSPWSDDNAMRAGIESVGQYLIDTYGATEQELRSLVDHRMIDMARKAMEYDRLTSEGTKIVKDAKKGRKVRTRTLKPGAVRTNPRVAANQRVNDEARERLSKSHSAADAHQVLLNRWANRT